MCIIHEKGVIYAICRVVRIDTAWYNDRYNPMVFNPEKNQMQNLASTLLGFVAQIHVFHWLTTSYAQHQALGGLYDGIHDLTDGFMEVYMGKYGRNVGNNAASMITYNAADTIEKIKEFEAFLLSMTSALDPSDTDLLNIRDEMLALVHKTQYLLTLS